MNGQNNTYMNIKSVIFLFLLSLVIISCGDDEPAGPAEVRGCTNSAADNYNAGASVDDGSCIISGCTDSRAENFDPAANNDDGACIFPIDKFIGSYLGSFACEGIFSVINEDTILFEISEPVDPDEKAKVTISFVVTGIPLSMEADVEGNDLIFAALTLLSIPIEIAGVMVEADITFSGGATIDNGKITATLDVTAMTLGLSLSDTCTLIGQKQ